jgi:hypothetical protein
MSLRITLLSLFTLLLGCSSATSPSADRTLDTEDASVAMLSVEGERAMTMLPNAVRELSVRYRDAQGVYAAGAQVEFALTGAAPGSSGAAPGSSLNPPRAVTDAQGVARTRLRVGSTPGELSVRASASNADPVYMNVSVLSAQPATLSASVRYTGARKLASYSVTAIEGLSCDEALDDGGPGEVVHTFQSPSEVVRFDLESGLPTAVVAWGRDQTGAKLARGCASFVPTGAGNPSASVMVPLENTIVRWDRELTLQIELDASDPTRRLAENASAAVERSLVPTGVASTFAESDYLIATLASVLRVSTLSASTRNELSIALQGVLKQNAVGPRAVGRSVGELLKRTGAGLLVETSYAPEAALGPITRVSALAQDGVQVLQLAMLPKADISASFEPASAQLQIAELRVQLGLGEYALSLLRAAQADPDSTPGSQFDAASGCRTVIGPWLAARPELAAESDRAALGIAACEQAIDRLVADIASSFSALNAVSPTLRLAGTVPVQDRTEDERVDDLGPAEVSGTWGVSAVRGEVRVPVQTALSR